MLDSILLVILAICVCVAAVSMYQVKKKLREHLDGELCEADEKYIMDRMRMIKITVYVLGTIGLVKIVLTLLNIPSLSQFERGV